MAHKKILDDEVEAKHEVDLLKELADSALVFLSQKGFTYRLNGSGFKDFTSADLHKHLRIDRVYRYGSNGYGVSIGPEREQDTADYRLQKPMISLGRLDLRLETERTFISQTKRDVYLVKKPPIGQIMLSNKYRSE